MTWSAAVIHKLKSTSQYYMYKNSSCNEIYSASPPTAVPTTNSPDAKVHNGRLKIGKT